MGTVLAYRQHTFPSFQACSSLPHAPTTFFFLQKVHLTNHIPLPHVGLQHVSLLAEPSLQVLIRCCSINLHNYTANSQLQLYFNSRSPMLNITSHFPNELHYYKHMPLIGSSDEGVRGCKLRPLWGLNPCCVVVFYRILK